MKWHGQAGRRKRVHSQPTGVHLGHFAHIVFGRVRACNDLLDCGAPAGSPQVQKAIRALVVLEPKANLGYCCRRRRLTACPVKRAMLVALSHEPHHLMAGVE